MVIGMLLRASCAAAVAVCEDSQQVDLLGPVVAIGAVVILVVAVLLRRAR
jgi:hypothetical protein